MQKTFIVLLVLVIIAGAVVYMSSFRTEMEQENLAEDLRNSGMLTDEDAQAVRTESVAYFQNVQGYYAEPQMPGEYPGVVMIHEWWGLNDNIREMAEALASEGYRVPAVDLHKGEVATTSDRARELTSSLNQEEALQNLQAATAFLRSRGSDKVASLGWCFGGGQSLQLALSDETLDATVIYYGQLVTDQNQLSAINQPVLGIFGSEDTSIPVATVNSFDAALDALSVPNQIYIYPGVGHAFANPSGQNYAAAETRDAWNKTLVFLQEHLK